MNTALNKSLLLFWITITLVACGGGSSSGGGSINLDVSSGPGYLKLDWTHPNANLGTYGYYTVFINGQKTNEVFSIVNSSSRYLVGLDSSSRYCIVVKASTWGTDYRDSSNRVCKSPLPDNVPPSTPINFQITGSTAAKILFSWSSQASLNNFDIVGFNLYRDGTKIRISNNDAKLDHRLLPDTNYCYRVTAYDHFNNESAPTDEICGRTTQDLENPSFATGLTATYSTLDGNTQIDLQWLAAQDDGEIDFYRVYRDGIYIGDVSDNIFTDIITGTGSEFCYTLIAVDLVGKESLESPPACGSSVWKLSKIANCCNGGQIAIDPHDQIHAAYKTSYFDNVLQQNFFDLHYVIKTPRAWSTPFKVSQSEDLKTNYLGRFDIAVDSNGILHLLHLAKPRFFPLAYYYETNTPGFWTDAPIENSNNFSYQGSIAIDSANAVHICYVENESLRYATNLSGDWIIQTLVDLSSIGSIYFCKIEVDSLDFTHIIYSDSITEQLTYITNSSGDWVSDVVDNDARVLVDAAITTNAVNKVMVAYFDVISQELRFASNLVGTWSLQKLEDMDLSLGSSPATSGAYPAIEVDSNGNLHISFINGNPRALRYATDRYGTWQRFSVDYSVNFGVTSLAVDSSDNVYIGYRGGDSGFWFASND